MQQSDVDRTLSLLYKGSDLTLKSITTLCDIISAILNQLDHDKSAKFLNNYVNKGGSCEFIECNKALERELTQKLRQEGIRFVTTASASMEGKKIIVYPDYSAPIVNRIVNEYLCKHNKGGITSKELVNEIAKGQMRKVKNLDIYEAELVAGMAKQRGINIAIEEPSKGTFHIVYAKKDAKQMDNIKLSAAFIMAHSEVYQVCKRHFDYQNQKTKEFVEAAVQKDNNIPMYFADAKGNTMIVTADKVTYQEYGGAETVIDCFDDEREKKIQDFLVLMEHPVELSKEEFQDYVKQDLIEKENTVITKDLEKEKLNISDTERVEIQKMRDNRILYEQKLAQDNPEQEIYSYSYLNAEMKMEEFKEFEKINYESVHDEKELRESDAPIIYDDARSLYRGFKDEIETVPYEEERYAEAVIDYDLEELKRLDKEFKCIDNLDDIQNDRNANMIPDDLEDLEEYRD